MFEAEQRVIGDVEAQHVALVPQQRGLVPLLDVRNGDRDAEGTQPALVRIVEGTEQRVLADRLVAFEVDVLVDRGLVDRDQRPALVLHLVKGTGLDE